MKKALFPLVLLAAGVIISAVVTSWVVTAEARKEGGFKAGLLGMQMEFMCNNSILRPITDHEGRADLQKYLNEVNTLMSWYFKNPASKFWAEYPDENDPESIIKEKRRLASEEGKSQRAAKGNLPIWEECFELVKGAYDQLKKGTYNALASDFQGSVRLDVHEVKRDGNKLKWVVLVWGGIGPVVYAGWNMKLFKSPTAEEKAEYDKAVAKAKRRGMEPEMKDPATLHFGESASASGHPVLPNFEGSEYIVDFPPRVQLNYFYTPTCPPDAEKVEMLFKIKSRAISGDDQHMEFKFMLPADGGWKGSWDGVQKIEAASDYGQ